jgi:hypothetical protein
MQQTFVLRFKKFNIRWQNMCLKAIRQQKITPKGGKLMAKVCTAHQKIAIVLQK